MKRLTFAMATIALLGAITLSAQAAGLLIADGGFGGVLEMTQHDVKVTINNGIAVTEVNQTFRNTENRQVEALYTFPVPRGASVANFSMWIDGKEMIGEVVEKQRAREIYESYKQTRRDPGLLEQTDYKTFEMRIFPIAAGAEQRVKVTYYQELDVDHDWATYVYPLSTVTRKGIDQQVTGRFALSMHVKSEVPIKEMESTSHRQDFVIAQHNEGYWQASLETPGGNLSRDVVLAYHLVRPKTGVDMIASKTRGEDGYFCLTLTAGEELAGLSQPMDYLFIMDISGSMRDEAKLATSVESVSSFIEALGEEDRFEAMAFNVKAQTLFNAMTANTTEAQASAHTFLKAQQAAGGTVLKPALSAAWKYADPSGDRPLNVVILSDGMAEQSGRTELLQLLKSRPQGVRVFCIGVGNDVDRQLLEQLAQDTGGLAAFVSRGDDFDRQAQAFRRKLTKPVATDVIITFEGDRIYDIEPQKLGNLYHGAPLRMYGRYQGAGKGAVATLRANVNGQLIEKTVNMPLPDADDSNPQIERMWAWHRIDRLLKEADRAGDRQAVLDEVVRLGEGYSITSEYASFIVLENDAEYQRWAIDRRNAVRIDRDRNAMRKLEKQLASMRDSANAQVGPAASDQMLASSAPVPSTTATPQPITPSSTNQPQPTNRSRGWDIDVPTGGGAIDPMMLGIAVVMVGIGVMAKVPYNQNRRKDQ